MFDALSVRPAPIHVPIAAGSPPSLLEVARRVGAVAAVRTAMLVMLRKAALLFWPHLEQQLAPPQLDAFALRRAFASRLAPIEVSPPLLDAALHGGGAAAVPGSAM